MPRIVKVGTEIHLRKIGDMPAEKGMQGGINTIPCIDLSDTIEIKKGWRPKDWLKIKHELCYCNPESDCERCCCDSKFSIETGFDACIEAMEKL
jgi:hypothetical protein